MAYNLLDRPDLATEVGFLTIYTANLDAWLIPALTHMLRGKADVAYGILSEVDNLGARLGLLFNVAEANSGKPFPDDLLTAKTDLLTAIALRNSIAHAGVSFRLDGTAMTMVDGVTSTRRGKPRSRELKLDDIKSAYLTIKAFIEIIRRHCGDNLFVGMPDPKDQGHALQGTFVLSTRHPTQPQKGHSILNFWKPRPTSRK